MNKVFKAIMITALLTATLFSTQMLTANASSIEPRDQEHMSGGGGVSPYPGYKWTYSATLKTTSLKIKSKNLINSSIANALIGLIPNVYITKIYGFGSVVSDMINLVELGNENYYAEVVQFLSSDGRFFYEEIRLYRDSNYRYFIGYYYTGVRQVMS